MNLNSNREEGKRSCSGQPSVGRIVFLFGDGNAYEVEMWTIIDGDRHGEIQGDIRKLFRFRLPPIRPGQTLANELSARGLAAHALALKRRVPGTRISEIVAEKRGISAETALRLGRYFGTGAAFRANLQTKYDLALAEKQLGDLIISEVEQAA